MNNCNVASNSTHASGFEVGGSADLTVPCAYSSGGSSTDSGLMLTQCADVIEEHPPVADPYASVPAPTWGSCGAMPNGSTINPGGGTVCYNSGTTINNATKTFGANSTVVISGTELRINGNATVNGTGVTFYLTNGATLRINGGAMLNLSAPTSGTHAGLLFFGDRTQASAVNRINGNSSGFMQGAIYFPSQEIDFSGNTGNHGCLQVIGDKITYTGSSTFNNNCAGTGVKTITVSGDIMLVE